jgi:hypothetical protein
MFCARAAAASLSVALRRDYYSLSYKLCGRIEMVDRGGRGSSAGTRCASRNQDRDLGDFYNGRSAARMASSSPQRRSGPPPASSAGTLERRLSERHCSSPTSPCRFPAVATSNEHERRRSASRGRRRCGGSHPGQEHLQPSRGRWAAAADHPWPAAVNGVRYDLYQQTFAALRAREALLPQAADPPIRPISADSVVDGGNTFCTHFVPRVPDFSLSQGARNGLFKPNRTPRNPHGAGS